MSFERRKARVGRVISDKMDKSVVVLVEWRRTHPLYRKSIRRRSRLVVHDVDNSCRIGDMIRVIESRPISKTKRWRVAEILSRQDIAEIQPDEITIDEAVATAAGVQETQAFESVSEQSVSEQSVSEQLESEESVPEQLETEESEPEQVESEQTETEESVSEQVETEQVETEQVETEQVESSGDADAEPDEGKRSE